LFPWLIDRKDNCNVFKDTNAFGSIASALIPGICTNIRQWFDQRSLTSDGLALTYDPTPYPATRRRAFACGNRDRGPKSSMCGVPNQLYSQELGYPASLSITSCDEFPFATSEEGGKFFGNLPNNPTPIAATCVPVYQQTLQGQCNSESFARAIHFPP
jgi:hypothetical protein